MAQKDSLSEELKLSIVNYLSGRWDECDSTFLYGWLDESADHRKLFGDLVDLWECGRLARAEDDFDAGQAWQRLESQMEIRSPYAGRFSWFGQVARYAAVFLLAVFIGALGYSWLGGHVWPGSSQTFEYTVPYGSKTSMKLLDGSVVWLNAGTTLKYNQGFGSCNRDLELTGEAYFEVARNKRLPFVVKTKDVSVQALGTKFNVKAYPEETSVEAVLLEGSIEVRDQGPGEGKKVLLSPSQKATYRRGDNTLRVSGIENASEVSWFREKWVIKNTRLEELARVLERRYNITVSFADEAIKDYEFGGTIKEETIEQVLTAISYSAPLKYTIINRDVSLSIDKTKLGRYEQILK